MSEQYEYRERKVEQAEIVLEKAKLNLGILVSKDQLQLDIIPEADTYQLRRGEVA